LNKNTYHSLELTRRLDEIVALGLPTLAALSNKDFIGETLDRPQHERLAGSLAAAVACVLHGARIVRVHDVRPTVDAVRMGEAILGLREPAYAVNDREPAACGPASTGCGRTGPPTSPMISSSPASAAPSRCCG